MVFLVAAMILVVATLIGGFFLSRKTTKKKTAFGILLGNVVASSLIVFLAVVSLSSSAFAQNVPTTQAPSSQSSNGLGLMAVALSTGLAAVGAGIAVGMTGAASVGAISEKPELLGRTLIYVGLAEGIVIYGLIVSIMILGRL